MKKIHKKNKLFTTYQFSITHSGDYW